MKRGFLLFEGAFIGAVFAFTISFISDKGEPNLVFVIMTVGLFIGLLSIIEWKAEDKWKVVKR